MKKTFKITATLEVSAEEMAKDIGCSVDEVNANIALDHLRKHAKEDEGDMYCEVLSVVEVKNEQK